MNLHPRGRQPLIGSFVRCSCLAFSIPPYASLAARWASFGSHPLTEKVVFQ